MAAALMMTRKEATQPTVEAAPAVVAGDDGETLYFVLIKGYSRWTVYSLANGEQAVSKTLEHAEAMMVEAKRHVERHSSASNVAATGLRIARSPTDEL